MQGSPPSPAEGNSHVTHFKLSQMVASKLEDQPKFNGTATKFWFRNVEENVYIKYDVMETAQVRKKLTVRFTNLLLDHVITKVEKGAPSTIKLFVVHWFSDQVLVLREICLETASSNSITNSQASRQSICCLLVWSDCSIFDQKVSCYKHKMQINLFF